MDQLPAEIVHSLLLEWLSPETVWTAVRASCTLRRAALSLSTLSSAPGARFQAAEGEVLSAACIRWFCYHGLTLALWTTVETDELGAVLHKCNGKLHRDNDEPAVIGADGTRHWFQNGEYHRDGDLPACVHPNGTLTWFRRGKVHRDGDQPAVIWADGTQFWYQHGYLHRDGDMPVEIWANGTQRWIQNGYLLHSSGGKPAVFRPNERCEWLMHDTSRLHRGADDTRIDPSRRGFFACIRRLLFR